MGAYEDAHEREQAEAALESCVRQLRRFGQGCLVVVMTKRGRIFRRISAPTGMVQAEIMQVTARRLNDNLGDLAMSAAEIVDSGHGPGYLDDLMLDEDEEDFK